MRAAANLCCQSAIIDGEAIVQSDSGASDFDALSSAMRWRPDSIILYAFDLMHLNGKDLRQQGLSMRRLILKDLLGSDEESRIQFSEEFDGDGDAFFQACARELLKSATSLARNGHDRFPSLLIELNALTDHELMAAPAR